MARNYQQAKIYCIKVNTEEEYLPYVGSSCKRLLSQRMNQHRDDYKKWKNGKHNFVSSFTLFEKYGIENCFIELIELFPCNCNDELRKKEREHIEKMKCVNMDRPSITEEERVEYKKEWYDVNKKRLLEKQKIYREEHKEQICEKIKKRYVCECGVKSLLCNKARHNKTKKHQYYLSTIGTLCSTTVTETS
jgi:hypothetical protein